MSKPAFTFPPPPPPPPKREVSGAGSHVSVSGNGASQQSSRGNLLHHGFDQGNRFGGGRNRGSNRGTYRGNQTQGTRDSASRGRALGSSGSYSGDLNAEGSRYDPSHFAHQGTGTSISYNGDYKHQHGQDVPVRTSPQGFNICQKRDHTTAFSQQVRGGPRPRAAPAVPSFLSSIPGLSPPSIQPSTAPAPEKQSKSRKQNQLGLTPDSQDPESSSEYEDEEVELAMITNQSGLQFEYRGQTSTLKSEAEIAAWIEERRRKFPTQAKAKKAKKELEEKKRKWEEEKKARQDEARQRKEEREKNEREKKQLRQMLDNARKAKSNSESGVRNGDQGKVLDHAEKARLKTEKLLKKAAKAQKQLAKAEDALRKVQFNASIPKTNPDTKGHDHSHTDVVEEESNLDELNLSSADSSLLSDSEATSSSGSSSSSDSSDESDSDSDASPETQTSRRTAPDRILAPPRKDPRENRNVCRTLLKTGLCKYGEKCRYSHELPEGKRGSVTKNRVGAGGGAVKRKSLYQVMVEKEQDEERRRVLRFIVEMGEVGMLGSGEGMASA